jgi:hypothetical protein
LPDFDPDIFWSHGKRARFVPPRDCVNAAATMTKRIAAATWPVADFGPILA